MAQFVISAISIGGTVYPGVGQFSFSDDEGVVKPEVDGSPDATVIAKMAVKNGLRFTSNQVRGLIDMMVSGGAILGAKISTLSGGVICYLIEVDELGRVAGNTHVSMTVASGVIVPDALTLQQGAEATLDVMILPVNAAGTDPVSVALNAPAPTVPEITNLHTLGRVNMNGSQITAVQAVGIQFGFDVDSGLQFSDGGAYPKFVGMKTRAPVITVTTRNADVLGTVTGGSIPLTGAGLEVFLTQNPADSLPTPAGTAQHDKITFAKGLAKRGQAGGQFIADVAIEVHTHKGSGAHLAWSKLQSQVPE
jgi:hypothetical protein